MANQYTPDPRQSLFLAYYKDPKSETFSNAYRSALRAGYSEEYSQNITGQAVDWLSDSISDDKLVAKAERNLDKFLSEDFEDKKIQADMTKFALERLNKKKYSQRSEVTGQDGEKLQIQIVSGGVLGDIPSVNNP